MAISIDPCVAPDATKFSLLDSSCTNQAWIDGSRFEVSTALDECGTIISESTDDNKLTFMNTISIHSKQNNIGFGSNDIPIDFQCTYDTRSTADGAYLLRGNIQSGSAFTVGPQGHGHLEFKLEIFEDETFAKVQDTNGVFPMFISTVYFQLSLTPIIRSVIFTIEGMYKYIFH